MRPIRYAGELPEDEEERQPLVIEGVAKVIDLPVLRPEVQQACEAVGKVIGIVFFSLLAWIVRFVMFVMAAVRPKEVL